MKYPLVNLFPIKTPDFDSFLHTALEQKTHEIQVKAKPNVRRATITGVGLIGDWEFSTAFCAATQKRPVCFIDEFRFYNSSSFQSEAMCQKYYSRIENFFDEIKKNIPKVKLGFRDLVGEVYTL